MAKATLDGSGTAVGVEKLAVPAELGSVPPTATSLNFNETVAPSAGTNQAMSEPLPTASVRNCPKDVPAPGDEEAVVKLGHQRSMSGSPAVRVPERVKVIGPRKLPAPPKSLLPKLAITTSSAEPPVKLVDVGVVKTLSVVLATNWSSDPGGIAVEPLLRNNVAAVRLIVIDPNAAIELIRSPPDASNSVRRRKGENGLIRCGSGGGERRIRHPHQTWPKRRSMAPVLP